MYKRNYGFTPRNFGGFIEDVLQHGYNRVNEEISAYAAPVNIQETENAYEMHVIAPGLKKDDFKINLEQGTLHISYEHKDEQKEQQEGKWLRTEYKAKSFKRSFTLNEKIDTGKISAKYTDGILQVTLSKKEVSVPPVQEISVN